MTEEKEENKRPKSFFDSVPSYLAGLAAAATATVAVLTYFHNQHVAPGTEHHTTPTTEPEVNGGTVGAVPSVEIEPTRPTPSGTAATGTPDKAAPPATPTLGSALRPARCAAYVGTWQLSSGELLTFLDDERVEARTSAAAAPTFGRYNCSGRNEELLYLMMDRANTLVFTASGDGKLYQRADQRSKATPLTATRAPVK